MSSVPSRPPATSLATLGALLCTAPLAAQTVQVPAAPSTSPSHCQWHMMAAGTRLQTVVDAAALAALGGRPLERIGVLFHPTGLPAATFPVEVLLGTTAANPAGMSPSFARNAMQGTTAVFTGAVTVPASTGTEPVEADVALPAAFPFDPAQGNLLVELRFSAGTERPLHLHRQDLAATTRLGTAPLRRTGNGAQPNELSTSVSLEPGTGRLLLAHYVPAVAGQAVAVAVGLSDTHHQGLELPFPLAALGLPGQSLLVAPQALFASTAVYAITCGFPMRHDGVQFALPLAGQFAGATYYTQAMVLGHQVTVGGEDLVVSDAAAVQLGSMTPSPAQAVFGTVGVDLGNFDPLQAFSQRAGAFVSPVLRLSAGH